MSDTEGPVVGSRCLASPPGAWQAGTIRSVHADGTFRVEFDVKAMSIMPYWHGVTAGEISFNDAALWPALAEMLWPRKTQIRRDDLRAVLSAAAITVADADLEKWWTNGCTTILGDSGTGDRVLDLEQTYRFLMNGGFSAKGLSTSPDQDPWYKLYWNQTRMGGRSPASVTRPVTIDDAFRALGIQPGSQPGIAAFEQKQGVRLPAALAAFFSAPGVEKAVMDSHCNSPEPLQAGSDWTLQRGLRAAGADGDLGIVVMDPHQGDFHWMAVFDEGDADARIAVDFGEEASKRYWTSSPSVGLFFWDLAQTGFGWQLNTKFAKPLKVETTDIGWAPAR